MGRKRSSSRDRDGYRSTKKHRHVEPSRSRSPRDVKSTRPVTGAGPMIHPDRLRMLGQVGVVPMVEKEKTYRAEKDRGRDRKEKNVSRSYSRDRIGHRSPRKQHSRHGKPSRSRSRSPPVVLNESRPIAGTGPMIHPDRLRLLNVGVEKDKRGRHREEKHHRHRDRSHDRHRHGKHHHSHRHRSRSKDRDEKRGREYKKKRSRSRSRSRDRERRHERHEAPAQPVVQKAMHVGMHPDRLKMLQGQENRANAPKRPSKMGNLPDLYSIHSGTVASIRDFGAFVRLDGRFDNVDGLVHVSEISQYRVESVEEVLELGESVWVKVIAIKEDDRSGKTQMSLSMKYVDQQNGRDLDPENVQLSRAQHRHKPDAPAALAHIQLEAVLNTTCTRCGGSGHTKTECYVQDGQKYERV